MTDDGVRVAYRGRGRELQVQGTSASWYQPGRLLTGSVWDALGCPIAALAPEDRRRGLLLGVGGGSGARIVRALAPDMRMVGVELDPEVVAQAREHMGLDELHMEIVIAEARGYLGRARAEYDLIVEDVFAGGEDGLDKPPGFPRPGLFLAASRLARGGLLVANTVHDGLETEDVLKERFRSVVRFEVADCTNEVYVATDERLSARDLRRAIASEPLLKPALGHLKLRTLQLS